MFGPPCVKFTFHRRLGGLLGVTPFCRLLIVAFVGGVLLLEVEFGDLLLVLLEIRRTHSVAHADA